MTPEDYIAQRVDGQIAWYRERGRSAKRKYKTLRVVEIVSAALIPLVAGFLPAIPYGSLVVAILGVIVAVSASLIALGNYHEIWVEYRHASEALKHQKYLFLTGAPPYDADEDAFGGFVQHVEAVLAKEHDQWSQHVRPPADPRSATRPGAS